MNTVYKSNYVATCVCVLPLADYHYDNIGAHNSCNFYLCIFQRQSLGKSR